MSAPAHRRPATEAPKPTQTAPAPRRISCFIAVGDSFTAGTDESEVGKRWSDRLADAFIPAGEKVTYKNYAVDGATSEEVRVQLTEGLGLAPDLVTIICGANDVLRRVRPDIEGYATTLDEMLLHVQTTAPETALVTGTTPERWSLSSLRPRTRDRILDGIRRVNEATRAIAAKRDVLLLDVAAHPGLEDSSNFADDGLHPSLQAHKLAADELAVMLRDRFGIESTLPAEAGA